MPKTPGNTVPPLPIQKMDNHVSDLTLLILGASPSNTAQTTVSYMGINPRDFDPKHEAQVQVLVDKHGHTSTLEIIRHNGHILLVDRSTQGNRACCDLARPGFAMAIFDDDFVSGLFIYDLMFTLAGVSNPDDGEEPGTNGMFIEFARKGYVINASTDSKGHLPFTWADVKTLLTL